MGIVLQMQRQARMLGTGRGDRQPGRHDRRVVRFAGSL